MASLSLSQVIYAVRDLDQATATAQSLGFTVVDGGRHPGLGTANRLIPLGDSYVELLAVVDAAEAAASSYGRAVLDRTRERDTLVRWSLRTDDLEKVARERGLEPEHRERRRSDGELVTWRAAGLELSLREAWLPFFMQWDRPEQY